jgi:hypothetical protein
VLTLFERLTFEQLPFYLHLMKHLAQRGIPVPDPAANRDGDILHTVCGKPAAVVNRLRGKSELAPRPGHCAAVGDMLARMHLAAATSTAASPTCAACPGGTTPCRWCCPTWTRRRPALLRASWPTRTMWPPALPTPRCRAARCMPTCSATT